MVPTRSSDEDLHGNAPDRATAALLIVDMINALDFPGNEQLIQDSERLGRAVARLKGRCREVGIPAIYVNDNYGKWRSDFTSVIRHCDREGVPGRGMVRQVMPAPDDYLVLQPRHSAFYATPLDIVLQYIGVKSLILAGISTNSCILLTASDAYVRDYQLYIPTDCTAGQNAKQHSQSLDLMRSNFSVNVSLSDALDLQQLFSGVKRAA